MAKRLIPKRVIKNAYTKDLNIPKVDLNIDKGSEDNLDALPSEIFTILGEVVSFIEIVNNEEEENENK